MLALPTNDPINPLKLADWLELNAIFSPDGDASSGDLEGILRVASFDGIIDDDDIERKVLDVFSELEQRKDAATLAYPFDVGSGAIKLKSGWEDYPAYTFCLFLSYYGVYGVTGTRDAPKLFEDISCQAIRNYIKGDAAGFGSPRKGLPSGFSDAVTYLARNLLQEGGGYRNQPTLSRKDDTLDLVAWADFVDKSPSKLIIFGQCAAGENWGDKLTELQPDAFWNQWMAEPLVSPTPIKSFFIPHRIKTNDDSWKLFGRKAGIIFERCRIAYWAHRGELNYSQHINWVQQIILQEARRVL